VGQSLSEVGFLYFGNSQCEGTNGRWRLRLIYAYAGACPHSRFVTNIVRCAWRIDTGSWAVKWPLATVNFGSTLGIDRHRQPSAKSRRRSHL
jgi:hypothetical protein